MQGGLCSTVASSLPGQLEPGQALLSAASLSWGQRHLPLGTFPKRSPGQSSRGCRQLGLSATRVPGPGAKSQAKALAVGPGFPAGPKSSPQGMLA